MKITYKNIIYARSLRISNNSKIPILRGKIDMVKIRLNGILNRSVE